MYESPITRITEDIMKDLVKREEGYLVESVRKEGFDIDKEELAKALRYDRNQYEKGFNDGRLSAEPRWIPVTERLPDKMGTYLVTLDYKEHGTGVMSLWFHNEEIGWDLRVADEVTAWMPLPEPCGRGASENE